jgi:small GTP-binding protein
MKRVTTGILAHVDAGKTTLSEAMLYRSGVIRSMGRVDHGDTFLDTDRQERDRGITIFSKQAELVFPDGRLMLLDTPGHVDFSAETERTLQVLDYAVLVISGKDGVQGHTVTLWKLLEKYNIPVFIFINKMDLDGTDRHALSDELTKTFGSGCVDFTDGPEYDFDILSMCSEALMEEILETGAVKKESLADAIAERSVFPCYYGSALKLEGVDHFLEDLWQLTKGFETGSTDFGARVYKITRDPKGSRLTHMKITGGTLSVKDVIDGEKAEQIRIYSGDRFYTCDNAEAGSICAAAGLTKTYAGQGIGTETGTYNSMISPVMAYRLIFDESEDPYTVYRKLKQLEEEDPQLKIVWNEHMQIIQLQLMGEVQLEVLKNIIEDRFGIKVEFGKGRITYRETISEPVIGSGHFEPLRHYAEVHLLMEPGEQGSGIVFETACSTDQLDINWQRLIFTHIAEKEHAGVLTGFPVTDMKITLIAGRAHQKHTEGGDFRQAAYRAIRQGLMKARQKGSCVLLEPWYDFQMEIPADMVGRAMSDIQMMGGSFEPPLTTEETVVLEGKAPASELKDYAVQLNSYTRGFGRLIYSLCGYEPCHDQEQVISEIAYDPESDVLNTGDSVFCIHGSGCNISWNEADSYFHINVSAGERRETAAAVSSNETVSRTKYSPGSREEDDELKRIFERTYGAGRSEGNRSAARTEPRKIEAEPKYTPTKPAVILPEYIFVDGYNVIFAWEELNALAKSNIDSAREALIDILVNYQGYRKCRMTVVFDAYRIKGGVRHQEKRGEVEVVFTKEDETADTYIERTTYSMGKDYYIRVVSSDNLEQQIVTGNGAFRVSAAEFRAEAEAVNTEIREILNRNSSRVMKETRRGIDLKSGMDKHE